MQTVTARLREARLKRGMTQHEVAEAMGTTQSAVARLEGGRTSPRLETLRAYAVAVGGWLTLETPDPLLECANRVRDALADRDADTALRAVIQLVDDVRAADGLDEALRREPPSTGDRRWDAAIAAAAAWAARQRGADAPGWAAAPSRFLDGPWFPVADILGHPPSAGLAAHLLAAAPADFFGRGVIIDIDTLESV